MSVATSVSTALSRRRLLQGTAGAAGLAAVGLSGNQANAAKELVVGFIYVGPKDDYGYNQAHAEAAAMLKKMPGVTVVEEERVPETDDVSKTMESMIKLDGATLLFPTSFGYFDPYMLKMAAKYKDIQFRHCGGLWQKDKHPMNTGSYFGYIGMCQYLNGIAAAHATKSKKIGFIAAKPIPQVLVNINSFALGARSVDPAITTTVIFTGEWSMPVKEAEAANSLADQGIDVLTCHVDGPKVDHGDRRAPRHLCVRLPRRSVEAGAERLPDRRGMELDHRLQAVHRRRPDRQAAAELRSRRIDGGLRQDVAVRAGLTAAGRKNVDPVKAEIMKGGFSVFKGPMKDNKGNMVIPRRQQPSPKRLSSSNRMNYLVEGVNGAIA